MTQCNRCGEHNHDDARYCGTCGMSLPAADGIGSLAADGADENDDTTPGLEPGAGRLRTSEYVSAPSFGETGAVVDPAPTAPTVAGPTTVAPPSGAPPAGPPPGNRDSTRPNRGRAPVPAGRPSSSTAVMFAALAVAAIVIIGGVFVLLAGSSGGTDVARTGDSAAPLDTSIDTLSAEPAVTAAPVESSVTASPPPATAPPTAPPAPPPSTAAPAPAPTVPPAPALTSLPPLPTPSRGPGDLGLTQPILDESCDGRYITFVGSAVGNRPYDAVVSELLEVYPGTNYIWTKACPSLRQEFSDGADIYGVVFGPYVTQQEACNARAFGPNDAYVRRISTVDPQDHTIRC